MQKTILTTVLTTILLTVCAVSLLAVPPTEEVIQRLKDEGRFEQFVETMMRARAAGVNAPDSPGDKSVDLDRLSPRQVYRTLVILIDFPDKPHGAGWADGSVTDFDSLLFSEGLNPTGSMKEFYYENSYGNFIMEGDVVGWYRAAENSSYYTNFCDGSHGFASYPNNAARLVEEAVDLADPDVDYSLYDNDGNGYVDGIFVVHSGTGYEESGNDCEIHSHKSSIGARFLDGVYVRTYSIEPEESAGNQSLVPIGVFCHEFGHVLGVPDLYDYDYSSRGAGRWALMASGSYNGNSRTPSQFIIWSKMRLGWVTETNVTANMTDVEIPAIEWNPAGYRLWMHGLPGNEYFLVENRQRTGFDAALPGSGVLIWHIDDNVSGNNNDWHPRVFLEQADGKFDLQYNNNAGDASDAYPANGYHLHFHDKTIPDSKMYSLASTEVAVWNISASDSIMTADFDVFWSRPYLYLTEYVFSDAAGGDGDGIPEAGESIELTVTVANDWKAAAGASLSMEIDDATLVITNGESSLGTIPSGGTADNSASPFAFDIPTDYQARIDSFFLTVISDGGEFTTVIALEQNVGKPAVLLVDDDNGDTVEDFYSEPLYNQRIPFDVWDKGASGTPGLSDLSLYDVIVWFVGDYRADPLAGADISVMQDLLDAGGNLFLTGQAIAVQLAGSYPTFLSDYLKSQYLSTSKIPILEVDPSAQVLTGLGLIVMQGTGGASNQVYPDHIAAIDGGVPELHYYGSSDLSGVSFAGAYRMVFFTFGFESIVSGDYRFVERDTVMYRVLDFFGIEPLVGFPETASLEIGPGEAMHLVDHTPEISWQYYDAGGNPQQSYHVQVGSDGDWAVPEMWDYGPITSSDTSTEYSGASLADGQTYHVRVRVYNGIQWSGWLTNVFRMNSVPHTPSGLTPDNLAGVASATPDLVHANASDSENDDVTYAYEVYSDDQMTTLVAQADNQPEGFGGTSSWTVTTSLADDSVYYWRVRAADDFEAGLWSGLASFWVNADNQPPAPFDLVSPADSFFVETMLPTFAWTPSSDADLYDALLYDFILATDEAFSDAETVSGLTDTVYTVVDSLAFGQTYFWKVEARDSFGGMTPSDQVYSFSTWLLGDANRDDQVNVGDAIFIVNYVFKDGPAPDPLKTGDVNQDCSVNVGDAVYLVNFIFKNGPPPLIGCE